MADAKRGGALRFVPAGPRSVAQQLWRKWYWWNAARIKPGRAKKFVAQLLASGRPVKLEIGSGPRRGFEEWVSLDRSIGAHIQHDLTNPLPFPDASVDQLYSSHVLEHFSYPQPMLNVLRECHRVLKPGSSFKIAVPNARLFLDGYLHPETFDTKLFCQQEVGLSFRNRMDVMNFIAYLGGEHKHLFDEENLLDVLREAGFREVRTRTYDPTLDVAERRHESVYAEAVK